MAKPKKKSKTKQPKTKSQPAPQASAEQAALRQWDLAGLAAEIGAVDATVEKLLRRARTDEQCLALGLSFATEDILASVPAFAGVALEQWRRLDGERRALFLGFDLRVLGVLVSQTV